MGKGRPRATKQLAQAAGGRGRIEPRLGCFLMWPLYLVRPHPFLLGKSLPKAESHSSGRGGFVRPASASRGLPAHRASSWLLLSAQRRWWGLGRWRQALAPSYHICLVERWVGPKEQIYCVSSALGSIPASQNWSDDKDKCVWLWAQSLRIYLAPAVIKK